MWLFSGRFFFGGFAWWSGLGFLFMSFLVPLHFLPWTSWHSEMLVFAGAVLTCGLLLLDGLRKRSTQRAVELPGSSLLVALIPALALLQWFAGMFPFGGDVLVACFYATLCICCLALGYAKPVAQTMPVSAAANKLTPCAGLACIFLIAGMCSVVIAWVQLLDIWNSADWIARGFDLRRPGGNLGQPNHLALLFGLAIVSVLYLRCIFQSIGTVIWLAAIVLLGSGIALTESRAGIGAVLASLAWISFKKHDSKQINTASAHQRRFGIAVTVLVVGLFFSIPQTYGVLLNDFTGSERLLTSQMRLAVWPQLMQAILIKPWLGWGVLQVAPAHNAVADVYAVSQAFSYSHTVFLDLVIWFGVPLALLMVSYLAYWFWSRYAKAKTDETIFAGSVLLIVAIGSAVEFSYSYAYFLAPALFCVGVLDRVSGKKACLSVGMKTSFAFLILWGGLMAWSAAEYLALEEDIRIARFQVSRIGSTPQGYQPPTTVLLTQLSAIANNSRIKLMPNMPPAQLTALKNTALRYPWIATQSRYALALAINGNPTEGRRQLQVMRAHHGKVLFLRVVDELNVQLQEMKLTHRFSAD